MRTVGSEFSRDAGNTRGEPHLEVITRFLARVASGHEDADARSVTMILRSAAAGPAQALIRKRQDLAKAGISVKVILAKLEPEEGLRQLFATLCQLSPRRDATDLIRWARNPRLLDAHEQVTYGDTMCWSGDAMRRDANRRNVMAVFEEEAPQTTQFGRSAFQALWAASTRIPERRLRGRAASRPSGASQTPAETTVAASVIKPGFQGWPLIRH